MTIRFIHTSDWQIGKVFRFVDQSTMGLLQEARLKAITRLGELAQQHDVQHVLVAGDVYDKLALSPRSLNQPLERMRKFPQVQWHLMPGNHDYYQPNGLWDQLLHKGLPENVRVHVKPEPDSLEDGRVVLLPAPLHHRRQLNDLTAYMDDVEVDEGVIRIGMAHGSVRGFGRDDRNVTNYIAPDRPERAGLSYLALGDWHGQMKLNDRCWYSGTPETDAFNSSGTGEALLVEIEGRDAVPSVTPLSTGHYNWISLSERITDRDAVDVLAEKLRGLADEPERVLVRLDVEGTLALDDLQYFEDQVVEGVSAAFCYLRVNTDGLFPHASEEDMDRIDRSGFVRSAADELKRLSEESDEETRSIAAEALQRLYIEHMKMQGGTQ
ncbi:metallophosphoesterase family protein [Fodinicurvata fenggangensis]|uniref:metallophosphoesterase family protein n=1 Tax=Fodinicurvata fenggangensis TaxID=1121830 RepID=UPI00068D87B9|nr:DNA repair exonuclease [Fodinicurvata fenggangensis]